MKLEGLKFNFLGDSITEGVGTSDNSKRYFEVLKEKFGLAEVNGYGISGTRIAKQIVPSEDPRIDMYFASRIDEMKEDVDAVVVFGGTNDYGHGDAPIGVFSDRTPDTFYGACHDLFSRLIEKYPGKAIIIMTPLHRDTELEPREKECGDLILIDYVEIIREVAEFYSLPVCDLFKNSGLQPMIPIIKEKFIPDGLHPCDAGHEIIAERLGNFLLSL